ncbi:MAG: hypothetical protein JWP46_1097 [Modestobacter sp.]|nr:hypothetical protein [Modestobacter sp.]
MCAAGRGSARGPLMKSVLHLLGAIVGNRPLARVVLAYAAFAGTQNAA